MSGTALWFWRGLTLGLLVVGCGGDTPASRPEAAYCSGLCRAAARCYGDRPSCTSDCIDERPALTRLSLDGATRLGDCVSRLDCSTLGNDAAWHTAYQACWDEARVAVAPSEHLRSVCSRFGEALFQCDEWLSTAECEDTLGMWSDAVLDQLAHCAEEPSCRDLDTCTQAVFEAP